MDNGGLQNKNIGIVGGTGELGSAIAIAVLDRLITNDQVFWVSNLSGEKKGFEQYTNVKLAKTNQQLVDVCELIVLCVPPAQFSSIEIDASEKLIITLVSGVTIDRVQVQTKASRIVRATSSPAADIGLAYSPWVGSESITNEDRAMVIKIFSACGKTDELDGEKQIDIFTVLTGPVPGYVAYFADCLTKYAIGNGIPSPVAEKAIKQLFLASGSALSKDDRSASTHVQSMIDYAGVTAAGLESMVASDCKELIFNAFDEAISKSKKL